MPRLKNQSPKLSKSGNYAYVYLNGERLPMGRYGSKEADQNYRRFLGEWATVAQAAAVRPGRRVNVEEIVCGYLDWAETNIDQRDFNHTKASRPNQQFVYRTAAPAGRFLFERTTSAEGDRGAAKAGGSRRAGRGNQVKFYAQARNRCRYTCQKKRFCSNGWHMIVCLSRLFYRFTGVSHA